jgi:hypothetical protein
LKIKANGDRRKVITLHRVRESVVLIGLVILALWLSATAFQMLPNDEQNTFSKISKPSGIYPHFIEETPGPRR